MIGASVIAPLVGSVLEGYKDGKPEAGAPDSHRSEPRLDVRGAALLSPGRLNGLAKEHNLTSPAATRLFISIIPRSGRNVR